jgi:hypothetical protein
MGLFTQSWPHKGFKLTTPDICVAGRDDTKMTDARVIFEDNFSVIFFAFADGGKAD